MTQEEEKKSKTENVSVLIVEDDFLVAQEIEHTVHAADYTVVDCVCSGDQALEVLENNLQPGVVLVDMAMPGMGGIETASRVTEQFHLPVVLLTAYDSEAILQKAVNAGIGAYLVKPPDVKSLRRAIMVAKARRNDLNQLHKLNSELQAKQEALQKALDEIKTLHAILPVCCSCQKVRDEQGQWHELTRYIQANSDTKISHGICPDCANKLYPEFASDE